jgi:hypothetical protein
VFRSNGRSRSTLGPGRLLEERGASGLRRGGWSACVLSRRCGAAGEGIGVDRTVEEEFVGYRRSGPSPAGADGGARRAKEARGEPERKNEDSPPPKQYKSRKVDFILRIV